LESLHGDDFIDKKHLFRHSKNQVCSKGSFLYQPNRIVKGFFTSKSII